MWKDIRRHIYRSWSFSFAIQFSNIVVLIGTFFMITCSVYIYENINYNVKTWANKYKFTIFLDDDISGKQLSIIKAKLSASKFNLKYDYIGKEETLTKFLKEAKSIVKNDDVFLIKENPLPASFEVTAKKENNKIKSAAFDLNVETASYANLAGVEDVIFGKKWANSFSEVISQVKIWSTFFICLLFFGCTLTIYYSIKNSILQRKQDIVIYELTGATRSQISLPYLFEGVFIGLMSSLVALFIVKFMYMLKSGYISVDLGIANFFIELQPISVKMSIAIVMFGSIGGLIAAYVSLRSVLEQVNKKIGAIS